MPRNKRRSKKAGGFGGIKKRVKQNVLQKGEDYLDKVVSKTLDVDQNPVLKFIDNTLFMKSPFYYFFEWANKQF